MSGLTKEQLKSELVTHGVKLPSPSARKDEYVRLYQKHVAPVIRSRGDFSSDDEDLPVNDIRTEATENVSMIINGLDVTQLDDDDLFARLKELGETVGPIVDTTRKVYQRKLYVALGGVLVDSLTLNGDMDENEYSDSEEEVVEEQPVATRRAIHTEESSSKTTTYSTLTATSPLPSQISDIRKRVLLATGENEEEGVTFDPDRHTPSPRRSLRTVTSSSSDIITTRKFLDNGSRGAVTEAEDEPDTTIEKPGKLSMCLRVAVKLIFLALILVLALYFYQNTPAESPFKAVEQLARQALEAAAGEEAQGGGGGDNQALPATPAPSPQENKVFP